MMMVDSATPMFTSEFTIIAAPTLMIGGLDTSNHMINEWNPLGPINSMDGSGGSGHHHLGGMPSGLGLHHHHSHDSFYG